MSEQRRSLGPVGCLTAEREAVQQVSGEGWLQRWRELWKLTERKQNRRLLAELLGLRHEWSDDTLHVSPRW